jgi:hypothetical protein
MALCLADTASDTQIQVYPGLFDRDVFAVPV